MKAEIGQRQVFRPGLGQYILLLSMPAFFAIVFAATFISSPLTGWSWIGVGLSVFCIVICAYVLAMRIELDDNHLSKVYFWGLFRSSIPLKQLRTSTNRQTGRGPGSVDFASVDPNGPSFNVVPFFAWRVRDIDTLKAIAIDSEQAISSRYDLRPDSHLESFVIDPGRTYPVVLDSASGRVIGQCKAGGAKGAFWIEPDFDTRYPHKDISFFAQWRADDAGVGHLNEVILITPTGTSEDDERRSSYRSVQVESPADPDHYDLGVGSPLPAGTGYELGDSDTGWMYVLATVAFLALVIGIVVAFNSRGWTWVLDVAAGLLSYAPFIAYGAYGGRLPNSRLILWPVRAAHLVFTIAIPVTIWIALHGLPCPPNCGPGT